MIKSNTPPPEAITRRYIAPLVRVLVLSAFLVTAVQSSADAAVVTVVNRTGQTIVECYYRASGTSNWNNAYLNGGSISASDKHALNVGGYRYIDLIFNLEDGTQRGISNLDVDQNSTLYVD